MGKAGHGNISRFSGILQQFRRETFCGSSRKMQAFYKDIGIDFLKECLSIPGVARKFLFRDRHTFSLFGLEDVALYKTIKKNIVSGPSIIFTRYHEAGKTRVRKNKLSEYCEV